MRCTKTISWGRDYLLYLEKLSKEFIATNHDLRTSYWNPLAVAIGYNNFNDLVEAWRKQTSGAA
jgi:hypothetical protein